MTRALPLLLAAATLLTGCGNMENSSWGDYFTIVGNSVRSAVTPQSITLEQAGQIPYASIGYRVNDGHQSLLVLATSTDGDLLWTAASRVVLLIRGGRIVRSVGLQRDRGGMTVQKVGGLPPLSAAIKAPYRSVRQVDMPDIGSYSQTLNCVTSQRGRAVITVLGTAMATIRVDEECQGNNPRWTFTDSYWLDPDTGFVWRSVQNLHPAGVKVETVIFRPPE